MHLDAFHPPPGFVPVRSHLDGVEVYAPAAPAEEMERRTRCGACGAGLTWDPGASAVTCPYCGHEASARAGEGSAEGRFTTEALDLGALGWGQERRELHCDGCGADLALDPTHLATVCPLCGSAHVGVRPAVGTALRPTAVLPFRIQRDAARESARTWLKAGWMRPSGLDRIAAIDEMQGLYLPFWVFHAELHARYTVQVGRDRVVRERKDGRTVTRTVTDWSWVSGKVSGSSGETVVPGTSRVALLDRAGTFPVADRTPYTPDVLVGFGAFGHDVPLADAWQVGRRRMRERAADWCRGQAGGDHQRNLEAAVDLEGERWEYVLLPVWSAVWRAGDRSFVLVVNGATGEVGGSRPVAWGRVYLAMAALLLPGLFTGVCIGLPTLLFAGVGLIVWAVAFVMLILGGVLAIGVWRRAVSEEGG